MKICVIGSGGVGKSCVTIRFLKNEFTEVSEFNVIQLEIESQKNDIKALPNVILLTFNMYM